MSGERTTGMPISSPGSGSTNSQGMGTEALTPELVLASEALDDAISTFKAAGENFVAAGGDPMELMRRFQAAVVG